MRQTYAQIMEAAGYTDELQQELDSVLFAGDVTPMGGYAVCEVKWLVHNALPGIVPPLALLRAASQCANIPLAVMLAQEWIDVEMRFRQDLERSAHA